MATSLHFHDYELRCSHCGQNAMQPDFLEKLERLRLEYGGPLVISSGYRCPVFNSSFRSGPQGPHTTGRAVDIVVRGRRARRLLKNALEIGFTGIGVKQKGTGRFLHLDDLTADNYPHGPRPWVWSY